MKLLALFLLSGVIAAGCASADEADKQKAFENLVKLTPPGQQDREDSKVYVDSVALISHESRKALLVSGNFPDGCTHLEHASHTLHDDTLALSLSAWRDPTMMCTQALTPFSFIYDKAGTKELEQQSTVIVNGTTYELK